MAAWRRCGQGNGQPLRMGLQAALRAEHEATGEEVPEGLALGHGGGDVPVA